MPRIEINTGTTFGRLTVVKEVNTRGNRRYVFCECVCGVSKGIRLENLRSGHTKSCGCLQREVATKHGEANSRLYKIWYHMKDRCQNEKAVNYERYGGRGISVCSKWEDFEAFKEDMEAEYKTGLELDRIDNSKGYSSDNCRWVTRSKNCRNRRSNRLITYNDTTRCLAEWSEITGIPRTTIHNRLKAGWSIKETLNNYKQD